MKGVDVLQVINDTITEQRIPVALLARKCGIYYEVLRKSLKGVRPMRLTELEALCKQLHLEIKVVPKEY